MDVHRHFAYDVFANNEMLGEEKSSFCVGSTRLQFAASRIIFAAALIVAFISEYFFRQVYMQTCRDNSFNSNWQKLRTKRLRITGS